MRRPKRNARHASNSSSAGRFREPCSTPRTFCSAICGFVRTLRHAIGVWSLSAPSLQIPCHLNRAMDNGLTQARAAEVITHLAVYVGWPNAFSALPVAKDVFEKRPR